MDMAQVLIFDLGWIFFATWGTVLIALWRHRLRPGSVATPADGTAPCKATDSPRRCSTIADQLSAWPRLRN